MSKPELQPDLVRQLASILKDSDLTEIEVEHEGLKIRLARKVEVAQSVTYAAAPSYSAPAAAAPAVLAEAAVAADPAKNPNTLRAVIVGTAYLAPEPGARPFVQVGDTVRQGQTVMIIEAMKHMNQISSPRAGKVTHIFISDSTPVEYDQPMMIIE